MSERYYITGAQLGMLLQSSKLEVRQMVEEIIENQFIGNMKEPYSDYEIIIRKMIEI